MGLHDATLRRVRAGIERLWALRPQRPHAHVADQGPDQQQPAVRRARIQAPRPATELEVVAEILRHVQDLEPSLGSIQRVASEIRTHGRSRADILLLANDLVSIEAKLSDWRRALGQAALNVTVVDRSYVAMWAGRISHSLTEMAEEHGIGVIEVHPDGLEIVVKAIPGSPDATARAKVLQRLEEGVMHPEGSA